MGLSSQLENGLISYKLDTLTCPGNSIEVDVVLGRESAHGGGREGLPAATYGRGGRGCRRGRHSA